MVLWPCSRPFWRVKGSSRSLIIPCPSSTCGTWPNWNWPRWKTTMPEVTFRLSQTDSSAVVCLDTWDWDVSWFRYSVRSILWCGSQLALERHCGNHQVPLPTVLSSTLQLWGRGNTNTISTNSFIKLQKFFIHCTAESPTISFLVYILACCNFGINASTKLFFCKSKHEKHMINL